MMVINATNDMILFRDRVDKVSIGFVPTMGALHEGHLSLIRKSVEENQMTIVSIFVNQLQFNSAKDYDLYPNTLEKDLDLCKKAGVDVVFAPQKASIYLNDHSTYCEVQGLDKYLCGAVRPGHFKGVCTVVLKLLNIVRPSVTYLGKKDYQQARIISKMVEDLNINTAISLVETMREANGLAMSSRNMRLSPKGRNNSSHIYKALQKAKLAYEQGEKKAEILINIAKNEILSSSPGPIDYISIVSARTLVPLSELNEPGLLAIAVFYDDVRLIDNIEL